MTGGEDPKPLAERPDNVPSVTQRLETGTGKVYVTIAEDENEEMFEVFINTGSSGGFMNAWCNALGVTISMALRSGADPEKLADGLMGVRWDKVKEDNGDMILSIPDAVGVAMQRHIEGKWGESVRDGPPEVELP